MTEVAAGANIARVFLLSSREVLVLPRLLQEGRGFQAEQESPGPRRGEAAMPGLHTPTYRSGRHRLGFMPGRFFCVAMPGLHLSPSGRAADKTVLSFAPHFLLVTNCQDDPPDSVPIHFDKWKCIGTRTGNQPAVPHVSPTTGSSKYY